MVEIHLGLSVSGVVRFAVQDKNVYSQTRISNDLIFQLRRRKHYHFTIQMKSAQDFGSVHYVSKREFITDFQCGFDNAKVDHHLSATRLRMVLFVVEFSRKSSRLSSLLQFKV